MEIEFSPGQTPAPRADNSAKGASAASKSNKSYTLQGMAELQGKLNPPALNRPHKMDAARQALSHGKYPPDELLDPIAELLAIYLRQ
jgi:hypothetical protein